MLTAAPGRVQQRQVERVDRRVADRHREQQVTSDQDGRQHHEGGPHLGPEHAAQQPGPGAQRTGVLPGQRVPRGAVRHREHQPVAGVGGRQQARRGRVRAGRQAAHQLPVVDLVAPGHVQGPAGQPDMAGRGLTERGSHERWRGHRGLRQHGAVGEEGPDALAQPGVEDRQYQPQVRIEFLGPQRRVEVAEIVLPEQGQRPGRGQPRVQEGLVVEFGALDDPDPRQLGDPPAMAVGRGRQDDGDLLAVPARQFLDHPQGQGIVPADDQMIAASARARIGGHGVILARTARLRTSSQGGINNDMRGAGHRPAQTSTSLVTRRAATALASSSPSR